MKTRTALLVAEMVIGVSGFALLTLSGGWKVALGVALMIWGNNIKTMAFNERH